MVTVACCPYSVYLSTFMELNVYDLVPILSIRFEICRSLAAVESPIQMILL